MDFLLFFLALVLIPISPVISQPSAGYYQIALLWPRSFCNNRHYPNLYRNLCAPDPPTQGFFTLHGLWPDNTTEQTTPTFCTTEPYTIPGPNLLLNLKNLWPNLLNRFTYKLWSDQWEKHDTCAYITQSAYFDSAINLAKSVNLDSWLYQGGMRNGPNTLNVTDTIIKGLGVIPIVKCTQYDKSQKQLSEVVVCYGGTGFIDCPRNRWPGRGVSPSNCPWRYKL